MAELHDVLIIGAGPVGLGLAMDLRWRGLSVTMVETREQDEPPSVKCNHISARSLENFRRLGIVRDIRDGGLPHDHAHDVAYRTSFLGEELCRITIPCRRDHDQMIRGATARWPTPEPPHRINQIYLEPILSRHARETFHIPIAFRTEFLSYTETETGIVARVRDLVTGAERDIRARYIVGCDGGRSLMRKLIGAELTGDAVVQRVQSSVIEAPRLMAMLKEKGGVPAWGSASLNPRRSGMVYAIDGIQKFLVHNYLREEEADFDSVDRDASIRAILGVDDTFEFKVIANEDWFGRRLVADRLRKGRAFICGDAAHLWVPFAGYGMNAGLADAFDLSWQLAAHLKGWAPETILAAYEPERQPIEEQVSHYAMGHAIKSTSQRRSVPANIEDQTPEGAAARAAMGKAAYDLNVQQYNAVGLNFGYFYDKSPIIAYDGQTPPAYTMDSYTPSIVPGARLPHVWLKDGGSLFDRLGKDFTLLVCRPQAAAAAAFVDAAAKTGVPLTVLDLSGEAVPAYFDRALVLARPDGHVAWRGNEAPADLQALFDLVRGAKISAAATRRAPAEAAT